MAGVRQYPTLDPNQRTLLLNALSSNSRTSVAHENSEITDEQLINSMASGAIDPSVLNRSNSSGGPPLFRDDPVAFDFDFPEEGKHQINGVVDVDDDIDYFSGEHGEKRKSPDEDEDDSDSEYKRQDGEDKVSKKPGRKPLMSEPTTKRKAQNRAAQRAFRERKEKHLKDLEQKVDDLEKVSEAANHENGLLRAQVNRLQSELEDYRKRLSSTSTSSPPRNSYTSSQPQRSSSSGVMNSIDFNFDFPKFGSLPGTQLPGSNTTNGISNPSYAPDMSSSPGSSFSLHASRSLSPGSTNNNTSVTTPSVGMDFTNPAFGARGSGSGSDTLDNMFNTDFIGGMNGGFSNYTNSLSMQATNGNKIAARQVNGPRSTSGSVTSNAASPSVSSASHPGHSSSCATSPEPYNHNSPGGQKSFETTNIPAGNLDFASLQQPSAGTLNPSDYNLDWLTDQGTNFDPVLFGEYRESQDAVIGSGEFTGGFFEDSFNLTDFDNPFSFNTSTDATIPAPPPAKPSLMEVVEKQKNGPPCTYPQVGPGDEKKQLMTAHKIWNTLQNCPKFAAGDFDIDGLCSELQTKAKCSETGVVVPKEDVEAALWRLAGEPSSSRSKQHAEA